MKKTLDRFLPERSFLDCLFPKGESTLRVRIPFFEDIKIVEQKDANLIRYSPISRSSELHTYTGAKARRLKLTFHITLQHVFAETKDVGVFNNILTYTKDSKIAERKKFTDPFNSPGGANEATSEDSLKDTTASIARRFFEGKNPSLSLRDIGRSNAFLDFVDSVNIFKSENPEAKHHKDLDSVVNTVLWWINIIRSTVTNSTSNPVDGPPIVRLFHGVLYNDVPCVVRSYNIAYDDRAGKELRTLLDNRIRISMDLEEVRAGDFSAYEPGHPVRGDNIAGWEELIDKGTTDPYITMFQWAEAIGNLGV